MSLLELALRRTTLEPGFDLANAHFVRRGRRFHRDREARCRAGRVRGESAAPEYADRERRAASYWEPAATSTECRMPSLSVKETRQVRAVGTRDMVARWRRNS